MSAQQTYAIEVQMLAELKKIAAGGSKGSSTPGMLKIGGYLNWNRAIEKNQLATLTNLGILNQKQKVDEKLLKADKGLLGSVKELGGMMGGQVKGQLMQMAMAMDPVAASLSGLVTGFGNMWAPLSGQFEAIGASLASAFGPEIAQMAISMQPVVQWFGELATNMRHFWERLEEVNISLADFVWAIVAGPLPWLISKLVGTAQNNGAGTNPGGAQWTWENWSAT